jgi:hypothetical protein
LEIENEAESPVAEKFIKAISLAIESHGHELTGSSVTTDALKLLRQERIAVADMDDVPNLAHRYSAQPRLPLAVRK